MILQSPQTYFNGIEKSYYNFLSLNYYKLAFSMIEQKSDLQELVHME